MWLALPVTGEGPIFPVSDHGPLPHWPLRYSGMTHPPFSSQAACPHCQWSFEITILMGKSRRKNELPHQEESSQHFLNRNTSTFILKLLRTWDHSSGSFLSPSSILPSVPGQYGVLPRRTLCPLGWALCHMGLESSENLSFFILR